MTKTAHRFFVGIMVVVVSVALIALIYNDMEYYRLTPGDRVYHPQHESLKPSGLAGHGLGIAGTLFIITGVGTYMARKRYRIFSRLGLLKHWLEFHIFLCTLGPVLILFHTAFKFGGLVAVSFWSMVAVFVSGIIGRFIYLQIPRSIDGMELSLDEVRAMKNAIAASLRSSPDTGGRILSVIPESYAGNPGFHHTNPLVRIIRLRSAGRARLREVKAALRTAGSGRSESARILALVRNDITLNRRIAMLGTMQSLFRYWHVAHLPFALVMLIIMVIHVAVTLVFGYRWIF